MFYAGTSLMQNGWKISETSHTYGKHVQNILENAFPSQFNL